MNTFTGHNTFIILFPTRPRAFFFALICSGCHGLGWADPRVYQNPGFFTDSLKFSKQRGRYKRRRKRVQATPNAFAQLRSRLNKEASSFEYQHFRIGQHVTAYLPFSLSRRLLLKHVDQSIQPPIETYKLRRIHKGGSASSRTVSGQITHINYYRKTAFPSGLAVGHKTDAQLKENQQSRLKCMRDTFSKFPHFSKTSSSKSPDSDLFAINTLF